MNYEKTKLTSEDRYYYVAFNYFQKIGPVNMARLEKFFPSVRQAFLASSGEIERAGLTYSLVNNFINWRKSPAASIEKMISELEKEKINFITWHDENYPALLKEIAAPPPLLYYKGSWNNFFSNIAKDKSNKPSYQLPLALAVVGSRQHSAYAEKIIKNFIPPLVNAGLKIVSGLALGVDSLAHHATLDANGLTLAVLGSGLNNNYIYPYENKTLAEKIIKQNGVIISEFPPGTPPYRQNFPQRNRIISGLTAATLVVEAPAKSGALITAYRALEQNREVLAVPGNIFSPLSIGPNNLIKAGARPIASAEDVLEIFGIGTSQEEIKKQKNDKDSGQSQPAPESLSLKTFPSVVFKPENETETIIYALIKTAAERGEKITADEIINASRLDTPLINSTLSIMELRGIIKNNGYYELS